MWETIRGYLTFTRKERLGVLFLLILISILFILPYFFRPSAGDPDPGTYEKMKDGIRDFEKGRTDSAQKAVIPDRYSNNNPSVSMDSVGHSAGIAPAELFYFDPNNIHANDWLRLGLSGRLTQTILHYIAKGGHFRKATDLKKVYGLRSSDYDRLLPFVRIAKTPEEFQSRAGLYTQSTYNLQAVKKTDSFFRENPFRKTLGSGFTRLAKNYEITDINQADSADWSRLPGIGAKLASRIVHFREKLGGFYQVDQVGETFGLPDSCFQKIKTCLRLNTVSLMTIDLNSASKETLQAHPYIRWQLAKGIIAYRDQHGGFRSVDELLQLSRMDPVIFEKVKPYLVVKP
jgi:competence protein ComEA